MKNTLIKFLAICLVLFSCSKEKKVKRDLDGKWNFVSYNGIPSTDPSDAFYMEFNKKKSTFKMHTSNSSTGYNEIIEGSFVVKGDHYNNLEMVGHNVSTYEQEEIYWTIVKVDKDELILSPSPGISGSNPDDVLIFNKE